MISSFPNIFKIPDLRKKIIFTLAMVVVYRFGTHIPIPGINAAALGYLLGQMKGTVFGLYDIFVGGALSRASVFALGIMPYISASIVFQLMGSVFPYLEKLQRDEEGRKKINQYTRYATVGLAVIQAAAISVYLEQQAPTQFGSIVMSPGFFFRMMTIFTLTAGTIFVMWLGEQITDHGIGNGISFLILVGCLDSTPADIGRTFSMVRAGEISWLALVVIAAIIFGIYAAVVLVTMAVRKIPVQYPKRIVGRRMYGGQSTHIPLRVVTAGVIPIIFAQSLIVFPSTFASFIKLPFLQALQKTLVPGGWLYSVLFAGLIIFFTYFYTSIVFNPRDLADNMQRYGGFIPGIRPGTNTARFIDRSLSLITLPGAMFLVVMALLPWYLMSAFRVPFYFGGTTLLIIVGVMLDTLQQIEAHLVMRHYEGLIKGGKFQGRRFG
ncbi:preprotein translocase subunit SecY [candidate division WOR-3 bacterium JGI_Cruoil_03_51_56]|uniref:Protein translocase subunit SecY n=1 Tax=candidate division WOR-3 bacterium JGI_Cruoil_03_51_56 TaxID=1973747 RepID=A0A235BVT0_UNCW3|nr:MAG: preprotein translocase subunit SecY [candidate division WOR-3 bacterium JGI_Cruoil_03_51_56]